MNEKKFNLAGQFSVNNAEILNDSVWTKHPVEFLAVRKLVRYRENAAPKLTLLK